MVNKVLEHWKKIAKGALIISISIILIIGGINTLNVRKEKKFQKGPLCTTNTIWIKHSLDADANKVIVYKIKVMNKFYKGHFWLGSTDESLIKETMTVEYLCNNPGINKLVIMKKNLSTSASLNNKYTEHLKTKMDMRK
jgi:hypothetical protein